MRPQSRKCASIEIVLDKPISNNYISNLKILSNCTRDPRKNDQLDVIDVKQRRRC